MVILLDIGNTAVTYGHYSRGRFHSFGYVIYNDIPKIFKKWSKSGALNNSNIVIGSVVPKITYIIKKSLERERTAKLWVVGENLPLAIKHRYFNFKRLGADRVVNIYGALKMYKPPLLMIDFGTAVTADYISAKGVFEGGMIIPGPETAFQALIEKAALLPKKIRLPKTRQSFLGRSTYECISSGILEGYGSMTDELICRFKNHFGKKIRVIATGGFAIHLKPYVHHFDILDSRHSIKSLLILFKDKVRP